MKFIGKIVVFVFLVCWDLSAQKILWGTTIGSSGYDAGMSVITDTAGNIYTIGTGDGTIDFDPGVGTSAISSYGGKIFVQKLDPNGNFIWAKCFGGGFSGGGGFADAVIDSSSNLYIIGGFSGTVDFDPGPGVYTMTETLGNFLLKLDESGNFVWVQPLGGQVNSVALNSQQNKIAVSGYFNAAKDFDPGPGVNLLSPVGVTDAYVEQFDDFGNYLWAKAFGGSMQELLYGLDIDKEGNIYTTGSFKGTVDFDPGLGIYNLTAAYSPDVFVHKLNEFGDFAWVKSVGGEGRSIRADALGNIFITGYFNGIVDFDPGPGIYLVDMATSGNNFLLKLDSLGNFLNVGSFGVVPYKLFIDKQYNLYVCGNFAGSPDFDPGSGTFNLTAAGANDAFVLKIDSIGNFAWANSFGSNSMTPSGDMASYVSVDRDQNVYVTGKFKLDFGFLDINGDSVIFPAVGHWDSFMIKISQDSCVAMTSVIDSTSAVMCNQSGYAAVHSYGGLAPYDYTWNSSPIITDSIAHFSTSGVYEVTIVALNGCTRKKKCIINGPTSISSYELNVNLVGTNFHPGQFSNIWLNGFNDGCDTISGNLSIVLDTLVNYDFAIPPPDNISGDTLVWNFSSISYDSLHITPQIFVTTDTSANIGDIVCFEVLINPIAGDADSSNNYKTYCFPVVNSYDPNIKSIYPQGDCIPKYVLKNEKLTYTIQFQNTGTADAINIYLLDTLDANLDLNSVRVIGNSHYVITEVLPGNVLKFRFDNIYLPDSTSDEPNSHGYVIYEVDPLPTVPNNTVINNTAHIFFDFNPAVVTNTVSNTIIDTLPNYSLTQNVNLICGSNYVFPDGTSMSDISTNITHINYLSPVVSCDSVITTNIIIDPIDVTITTGSIDMFTANASGLSYQWVLDCGFNWTPIPGETNQTFNTGMEGLFGVIITNGSCSDTSICYTIGAVNDLNQANNISVYPNPTNNSITISTLNIIATKIELKDVYGRTIKSVQPNSAQTIMDLQNIESGIYFVHVVNGDSKQTVKILKQ